MFKILFVVILINFIVDETLGEESTEFFIDDGDYMDMDLKDLDLKVKENRFIHYLIYKNREVP